MNSVEIPRSNISIKSRIPVPVKNSTSSNLNKNSKNVLQQKPSLLPSANSTKPTKCKDAHAFQKNIEASKSVPCQNKIIDTYRYKKGISNPILQKSTLPLKTGQIQKSDPKYVSKISKKANWLPSHSQQNKNVQQTNQKTITGFIRRESVMQNKGNKVKESGSLHVKSYTNKNAKQAAIKVESDVNKKKDVQKTDSKVVSVRNDKLYVKTDFEDNVKEREPDSIKSKTEKNISAMPSHIVAQKDLRFEASDLYRNMILNNRPISPGILKSGHKLSSIYGSRTSIYQKLAVSENPLKDVLREIENVCLSVKRNSSLALPQNKLPMSPFKDRNSFYTPCADPKAEVMRSLEKLRTKKMLKKMKNEKKVTFDLNIADHNPKVYDIKSTPFRNECRLTQITENSKENTPISPESKISESVVKQNNAQTSELKRTEKESNTFSGPSAASIPDKICDDLAGKHSLKFCDPSQFCTPVTKTVPIDSGKNTAMTLTTAQHVPTIRTEEELSKLNKLEFKILSPVHISDNVRDIYTTTMYKERNFQSPMPNRVNGQYRTKRTLAKLCTPQPVSLFCKSSAVDISSPEFLMTGQKNSMLAEFAPICTPFVLKSLAKSTALSPEADLSPIRIKLDFTEEKGTPKKDEAPTKSYASLTAENIATVQKKLDLLADEECSLLLKNATIQVACGRYLKNPVAWTLDEGDEMHFLPIRF